jgi:hypothetical protein
MNRGSDSGLAAVMILVCVFPLSSMAAEEDRARQLCKSKIEDVYGIERFRNVWSEREGNHKYRVHGRVKRNDHLYDVNCKIKNGHVQSYAYNGPHKRHRDDDDDNDISTAVAVGAGLAIIAAVAMSQSGEDDDGGRASSPPVSQSVLEDDCHDMLQYRVRDEHDYSARVDLKDARLEGHDLVGDARVWYDRQHPHHATYTCHFDSDGRIRDSRYHLY